MKVLYIAAECKPFSQAGGVADVSAGLPPALMRQGVDVEIVTPLYGAVERKHVNAKLGEFSVPFAGRDGATVEEQVAVYEGVLDGVPVSFIQNATYFEGEYAKPYIHSPEVPFYDDILRFSFFSEACLELIKRRKRKGERPDVVHVNDWPLGYLLGRMVMESLPHKRVMTLHNIGYQGNISRDHIHGWHIERLLHSRKVGGSFVDPRPAWNSVNALRLGLECADIVHAVSPRYAQEATLSEDPVRFFEGGKGLEETAKALDVQGRLVGILNGYNYKFEATDETFAAIMREKVAMKQALSSHFSNPYGFLLGFVGRAVEQKFRLLMEPLDGKSVLEHILDIPGVNVAVLASGLPEYETFIASFEKRGNFFCKLAFDREKAHEISLGSDVFLMPSLFEPCGITQMESLSNATPPLVRATGGLADTVKPHTDPDGTGFMFDGDSREAVLSNLIEAVHDALDVYKNDRHGFSALQRRGFGERFLWSDAARKYIEQLYEPLLGVQESSV